MVRSPYAEAILFPLPLITESALSGLNLKDAAAGATRQFPGFTPLDANFIYCPNQFFDVCLSCRSRGVVRLVTYLLKRTLGWLDSSGDPIEQEVSVSYRDLIAEARISRGAIAAAVEDAVAGGFVTRVARGSPNSKNHGARQAELSLRWDANGGYQKTPEDFCGFYSGEGHRSPIPNAFFDIVVPREPLAVAKVVGVVLRHTVGYQNQFGGRRTQAPLS